MAPSFGTGIIMDSIGLKESFSTSSLQGTCDVRLVPSDVVVVSDFSWNLHLRGWKGCLCAGCYGAVLCFTVG